jgi:hypothetical protein
MERMSDEPFSRSTQASMQSTFSLPEEEKMLSDDARKAFSMLSQSADEVLKILGKAATLRQDIFFALSLFDSLCNTPAQFDKLWRLAEIYRMAKDVKDSKNTFTNSNAKSADSNDLPRQTSP